ncbi:hypothetical protein ACJQWK_00316 [Exserohilum turcicum]
MQVHWGQVVVSRTGILGGIPWRAGLARWNVKKKEKEKVGCISWRSASSACPFVHTYIHIYQIEIERYPWRASSTSCSQLRGLLRDRPAARVRMKSPFTIRKTAPWPCQTVSSVELPSQKRLSNTHTHTAAWFLVPVPKADVKKALQQSYPSLFNLGRLKLLPVPAELNLGPDMHPVVVSAGRNDDIRQGGLQLATALMVASSMIPYVGVGDSQTPLNAPLVLYVAGVDSVTQSYVYSIIPSIVGKSFHVYRDLLQSCPWLTLGGLLTRIGAFIPQNAAFQTYSDGSLGVNSKWAQAPNPASGPGLYSEAIDLKFISEPNQASPRYSLSTWKKILNQPSLLANALSLLTPRCQRITLFFNNSTAQPTFRTGNVTLGPSAGSDVLTATLQKASSDGSGFYQGVYGFSSCAQNIGYGFVVPEGEDCEAAAQTVANTPGAL